MIITIDGPVASGKSTISRMLAQQLGCYYLCSGLLYRALAYLLIHNCGYTEKTIANPRMDDVERCLDADHFVYHYDKHSQEFICFDDQDITPYLKDKFMDNVTSLVSVNEYVRSAVSAIQRNIAVHHSIVTDGRDVGSVVFPQASFKFFVTASAEVRAQRWRKDQEKYGNYVSVDQARALITDRDNRDKNRTVAPLIIPHDAIIIDTTRLSAQQAVELMMNSINGCEVGDVF